MQTDKRITSKSKNDVVRENHLCLVFCVLLFCFTISHFFILSVESAEFSDTDSNQMEGTLAAILNSERINPEPTKPLTEPLLEIVTELPDSELMVPFLELIYAVTPSEGETLEEVYVKVNGVFDRHLYQRKAGEPEVKERTFGEARLFLSTDEQKSKFELVAVDSSNLSAIYPIEQSFFMAENPVPPLPSTADVSTIDSHGEEVTFINNRLQLQLSSSHYNQEDRMKNESAVLQLLDELSYYDIEMIAGPNKNGSVTVGLKQNSYSSLYHLINDLPSFSDFLITDAKIEEIDLATAELIPREDSSINRSGELEPKMVKIGWVPGLFFRRYQHDMIGFKLQEETSFLNQESFPETYLSRAMINKKIDEVVSEIDGVRIDGNQANDLSGTKLFSSMNIRNVHLEGNYPFVRVSLPSHSPRGLIKNAKTLLKDHSEVFEKSYLMIVTDIESSSSVGIPEVNTQGRQLPEFEHEVYRYWATINKYGTVSSLIEIGLKGLSITMKVMLGIMMLCVTLTSGIIVYRRKKRVL